MCQIQHQIVSFWGTFLFNLWRTNFLLWTLPEKSGCWARHCSTKNDTSPQRSHRSKLIKGSTRKKGTQVKFITLNGPQKMTNLRETQNQSPSGFQKWTFLVVDQYVLNEDLVVAPFLAISPDFVEAKTNPVRLTLIFLFCSATWFFWKYIIHQPRAPRFFLVSLQNFGPKKTLEVWWLSKWVKVTSLKLPWPKSTQRGLDFTGPYWSKAGCFCHKNWRIVSNIFEGSNHLRWTLKKHCGTKNLMTSICLPYWMVRVFRKRMPITTKGLTCQPFLQAGNWWDPEVFLEGENEHQFWWKMNPKKVEKLFEKNTKSKIKHMDSSW